MESGLAVPQETRRIIMTMLDPGVCPKDENLQRQKAGDGPRTAIKPPRKGPRKPNETLCGSSWQRDGQQNSRVAIRAQHRELAGTCGQRPSPAPRWGPTWERRHLGGTQDSPEGGLQNSGKTDFFTTVKLVDF